MGGIAALQQVTMTPLLLLSSLHHETVISTEAVHSLIVSSAAEKSASLPPCPQPTPRLLLLRLPVLLHGPKTHGCPIHRALCDGWGSQLFSRPRRRCFFYCPLLLSLPLPVPSPTQSTKEHCAFERSDTRILLSSLHSLLPSGLEPRASPRRPDRATSEQKSENPSDSFCCLCSYLIYF
jgi:hypothetical protein